MDLQEKFAAIVQKFERIRRHGREATRQAENLFQTLLTYAFRGELWIVFYSPNGLWSDSFWFAFENFAGRYGFTEDELDFIINYDIKYRMGRED